MGHQCSGGTKPFAVGLLSDSSDMNGKSCSFISKNLKINWVSTPRIGSLADELKDSKPHRVEEQHKCLPKHQKVNSDINRPRVAFNYSIKSSTLYQIFCILFWQWNNICWIRILKSWWKQNFCYDKTAGLASALVMNGLLPANFLWDAWDWFEIYMPHMFMSAYQQFCIFNMV